VTGGDGSPTLTPPAVFQREFEYGACLRTPLLRRKVSDSDAQTLYSAPMKVIAPLLDSLGYVFQLSDPIIGA